MAGLNDLGDILCWRETRRVSQQLIVHYNRMKFTLHPTEITARLVGQAVEIYDFPDGRLEIRWKGLPLAYAVFDKLQRVSHAAIVENKRLGEVLAWIKQQLGRLDGDTEAALGPAFFDTALEERIRKLQAAYGLTADGIVGQETLFALSSLAADGPRLARNVE